MASHHYTRVNTLALKDLIYRRIGRERAENYFDQLKRFLSLKLSKVEFDKSCKKILGRENIPLHNKLIRAIIQNACRAKAPPEKPQRIEGLSIEVGSGYQRSCLQSLYGDSFPQSPRKCRSPSNRDRKCRDRPSPLGPLGKSPSLTTYEETLTRLQDQSTASEFQSLCSKFVLDDGEEVEQLHGRHNFQRWNHVNPPIGVSINDKHSSFKSRKYNLAYNAASETCQSSRELPDTTSLSNRLKQKLASEELGISVDCAELLNKGLEVYLKRLIEPCISMAGSRYSDRCNNMRQPNDRRTSAANRPSQKKSANMRDFSSAVESNPCILGVDWPLKLEKICHYAMEE